MIKEFYSHLLSSMDIGKEPYFGLFSTFLTQGFVWPSIGPSVHLLVENCKNAHFRGSHYNCVCASVCGVGAGMNGGCAPLPTCPQWYCDPTSLVILRSISILSATIFLSDCLAVSFFFQSDCLYHINLSLSLCFAVSLCVSCTNVVVIHYAKYLLYVHTTMQTFYLLPQLLKLINE